MKVLVPFLALLLTACASTSTLDLEAIKRQRDADYSDLVVEIHSLPSGAMIDLNGDVVGITPCKLELKRSFRGNWPSNGYDLQALRCRWADGHVEQHLFLTNSKAPKQVAFINPHRQYYTPKKPLTN
jgi:hypothetical protein